MNERPRICLIDDDPFVRDAMSLGLGDQGYEVIAAPGAFAGLDVVNRGAIDLVITDINMPGYSGAELTAALRKERPTLPIIAISGAGDIDGRSLADVAREAGADAFLIKPFRARELAALVEQLLAKTR